MRYNNSITQHYDHTEHGFNYFYNIQHYKYILMKNEKTETRKIQNNKHEII
jgi:hypothetical protein